MRWGLSETRLQEVREKIGSLLAEAEEMFAEGLFVYNYKPELIRLQELMGLMYPATAPLIGDGPTESSDLAMSLRAHFRGALTHALKGEGRELVAGALAATREVLEELR